MESYNSFSFLVETKGVSSFCFVNNFIENIIKYENFSIIVTGDNLKQLWIGIPLDFSDCCRMLVGVGLS